MKFLGLVCNGFRQAPASAAAWHRAWCWRNSAAAYGTRLTCAVCTQPVDAIDLVLIGGIGKAEKTRKQQHDDVSAL